MESSVNTVDQPCVEVGRFKPFVAWSAASLRQTLAWLNDSGVTAV